MEFTVSKADLVKELNLSQGVVEKKTTIPILSNVLVETAQDHIVLTATDLELGIRCQCPAKVQRGGAGTIPARRLLDYVRLLPDAPLNVKMGDNQWVSLVCGRSRTRMAGMSRESFPELPEMSEKVADLPIKALVSMISKTIFAISFEESRFTLNGALLLIRPKSIVMVATDGHRLSMVEYDAAFPDISGAYRALLPRKAMGELLKLASDAGAAETIAFAGNDNHLFFQLGERLLMCRKLSGNFPDFERVLPKDQPHEIVISRDELRAAIERVSQFAEERSHSIKVRLSPGEAKIHSSLSDTGDSEEVIPVEYGGEAVEIGFNAQYLLDFLRAIAQDSVTIRFKDGNSAAEFRPAGESVDCNYRYVVMPMRI